MESEDFKNLFLTVLTELIVPRHRYKTAFIQNEIPYKTYISDFLYSEN